MVKLLQAKYWIIKKMKEKQPLTEGQSFKSKVVYPVVDHFRLMGVIFTDACLHPLTTSRIYIDRQTHKITVTREPAFPKRK